MKAGLKVTPKVFKVILLILDRWRTATVLVRAQTEKKNHNN